MPSCAISSCTSTSNNAKHRDVSFFRFPKDRDLSKAWVKACKRSDAFPLTNAVICSNHFDSKDIEGNLRRQLFNGCFRRKLVKGAVPTLNLTGGLQSNSSEDADRRKERYEKRETRKRVLEWLKTPSNNKVDAADNNKTENKQNDDKAANKQSSNQLSSNESNNQIENEISYNGSAGEQRNGCIGDLKYKQLLTELDIIKQEQRDLRMDCVKLQQMNTELTARLTTLQEQHAAQKQQWKRRYTAKMKLLQDRKKDTEMKMNEILRQRFTPAQVLCIMKNRKCTRWGKEDILNALALQALNKKSYVFARKVLGVPLPGLATIQRWIQHVDCAPGILNSVLEVMKSKVLSGDEKYCVLSVDQMKIDPRMSYDFDSDTMYRTVSRVQVVMVCGLFCKWKQIVYYDFDVVITKDLLINIISNLFFSGYEVVACVSDFGTKPAGIWEELGISDCVPSFPHPCNPSEIVWVFADMLHMMKLLRQHILNSTLILEDQTVINKDVFAKLLPACVDRGTYESKKVNLAAQLFSGNTSETIRHIVPQHTRIADFVKLTNDTFDVFNSSGQYDEGNVPLRCGFGVHMSEQEDVLLRMRSECTGMKACDQELLTFQKGILLSIESLLGLFRAMCKSDSSFILTRRLSLDCIKQFFSQVRGLGRFNEYPSPTDFKDRLRLLMIGTNTNVCVGVCDEQDNDANTQMITQMMFTGMRSSGTIPAEVTDCDEDTNDLVELDVVAQQSKDVVVLPLREEAKDEEACYAARQIETTYLDVDAIIGTVIQNETY